MAPVPGKNPGSIWWTDRVNTLGEKAKAFSTPLPEEENSDWHFCKLARFVFLMQLAVVHVQV